MKMVEVQTLPPIVMPSRYGVSNFANIQQRLSASLPSLPQFRPKNEAKIGNKWTVGLGVSCSNLGTALFKAVMECRISKVRFLLKNGHVSKHVRNDNGHNLLMAALFIDNEDRRKRMFQYLLDIGVDFCYRHPKTRQDVLGLACMMGRAEEVKCILDTGMGEIDLNKGDSCGFTPLHLAVKEGHADVVQQLIQVMERYGLSVDVPDKQGLTPYMYARRQGNSEIAHLLVRHGNACIHRRDTQTFRSADDWAVVGAEEDLKRQRRALRKQVAQYRIQGVLPPISEIKNFENPTITITQSGDSPTDDPSSVKMTERKSKRNLSSPRSPMGNRVSSLMALNDQLKRITHQKNSILNKSVDTAFTLLGIKAEDSMIHATHFVQSEPDTSKADEYASAGPPGLSTMGQLSEMMHILSDQQSSSFRKVAVKPRTPPIKKKKKEKQKVSTLAILMGKERRQRSYNCRGKTSHKSKKACNAKLSAKKMEDQRKDKKKVKIAAAKMHHAPDAQIHSKKKASLAGV